MCLINIHTCICYSDKEMIVTPDVTEVTHGFATMINNYLNAVFLLYLSKHMMHVQVDLV